MKFKKLRKIIAQTECVSINASGDDSYEAYLNMERVPKKYDDYKVIGISTVSKLAIPDVKDVTFDGIEILLKK